MGFLLRHVAFAAVVYAFWKWAWAQWPGMHNCKHFQLGPKPPKDYCAPTGQSPGKDLETRGFTVVDDFLDADEVAALLKVHDSVPKLNLPGQHIDERNPYDVLTPKATRAVEELLAGIQRDSFLRVAEPDGNFRKSFSRLEFFHSISNYSSNQDTTKFPWHQDHGYYWESGQTFSLALYIFLDRPSVHEAGLGVASFEELRDRSPAFTDLIENQSGVWYNTIDSDMMRVDIASSHVSWPVIDFHVDNTSCFPPVKNGGLVVLRGDTIHRTQNHNSWRKSVNLRVAAPEVSWRNFLFGGNNHLKQVRDMPGYLGCRWARTVYGVQEGCRSPKTCTCPEGVLPVLMSEGLHWLMMFIGYVEDMMMMPRLAFSIPILFSYDHSCLNWPNEPMVR